MRRRTSLRRRRIEVDTIEQVIEHALLDQELRRAVGNLRQTERARVEPLVELAHAGAVEEQHLEAVAALAEGLDPEAYLRDLFAVLPQWPRDRYLELAPKYWRATRARLDAAQLEQEIAWFTIPPPPSSAEQSAAS